MAQNKTDISVQEQLFLDCLFDGTGVRSPEEAKLMAGYERSYPVAKIIKNIKNELIDRCDGYLAMYAPQGVLSLMEIALDPLGNPGNKLRLQAIIELLDRGGVTKKEKVEQTDKVQNFMFILPEKNQIN